jgi:hypothetical protein
MKTSGLRAVVAIANVGALLFWPLLGSDAMRLPRKLSRADASAAETKRFRLEVATIADVHRAFRAKQLTATQLVNPISIASKRITARAPGKSLTACRTKKILTAAG